MALAKSSTKPIVPDDAPHILAVDDDARIRGLLLRFLSEHGYRVSVAADALEARQILTRFMFDLVVLDVMMPGENGFDLAKFIRESSQVPVLMLTARVELEDRLKGLQLGADDYLGKPFDPRELLLRISGILRRVTTPAPQAAIMVESVQFGAFVFHLQRGELRMNDEIIRITERERDILRQFAAAPEGILSREALFDQSQGSNERTVDVQINRLRRKIEVDIANPLLLQTIRGRGYRLMMD